VDISKADKTAQHSSRPTFVCMTTEVPVTYEIKLPQFEGPFDLLLFFIERDELDIYDIPIANITNDFLYYMKQATVLNIELASEFIVVAASLMRIKAKMLLPRKEMDSQGNEIDPRDELVKQLLEYKRYKEILDEMRMLEDERAKMYARGNVDNEMEEIAKSWTGEAELHTLTLFKLLKAYEKAMSRQDEKQNRPIHKVKQYAYTAEGQKEYLLHLTSQEKNIPFQEIFSICENRIHAIFLFLAMLDLLQQRLLTIQTGLGANNFWVSTVV
jgi:segregation and condensation protein A